MRVLALIMGIVGGLCVIMGILTAAKVIPLLGDGFTGVFWLGLAGVLFLAIMVGVVIQASKELLELLG